jgi:UPF0148 protein
MSGGTENIREMADLLRQGETLTALSCPKCSSPLFRMRSGELWCASCKKQVIEAREGETKSKPDSMQIIEVRAILLEKLKEVTEKMKDEADFEKIKSLSVVLSSLLENLEKFDKIMEK